MNDFDITSFRSKPKKSGKKQRIRDPNEVTTSFTKYLEKRKALGLDDSDSDSNSDTDLKRKTKKQIPLESSEAVTSVLNVSNASTTDPPGPDIKHFPEVAVKTNSPSVTAETTLKKTIQDSKIMYVIVKISIRIITMLTISWFPCSISLDSDEDEEPSNSKAIDKPATSEGSTIPTPVESNSSKAANNDSGSLSQTSISKHEQSSLSLLEDFDDLDPDLAQSFLEASPEHSFYETSIEESTPQKIAVKFHMRLYPDAASENKSPTPDEAQIRKVLKILVMDREPLELAIHAFACHKHYKLEELIFVYNNTKVWPIATPAGLGMQADRDNNIDVYLKDTWAKKLEREEQIKQERLTAQMKADAEFSDGEAGDSQTGSGTVQDTENNSGMLLKVRGKDGHDTMMKVKPTTTIAAIIKHYRNLNNLGDVQVKLLWDDLTLDDNEQVQDTDLEDEDMISATW
ncbi:hypothetical protein INT43_008096 [Umbelopsis isabellina]|uniref:Ubiquitin-like domain-containing protein n=1 Tax=Mortierella isabellina TaxID=91625 RepID=A0A8H7PD49_MORIS|nr:hypothetical protein INT43_008096 [Umbelopsis isabellina]